MSPPEATALVVGAGIAGSELAWGLARRGVDTLLVTTSLDTIANLPGDGWGFEPPPGGVLEHVAATARDDRGRWRSWPLHRAVKRELERLEALHVLQSNATALLRDADGRVVGVRTWEGVDRRAGRVALCVGTFLGARLRLGGLEERAGRLSEMAYDDLFDDLQGHGLRFEEAESSIAGDAVTPGYRVRYHVLAPGQTDEHGRVAALPGLWAFGRWAGGSHELEDAAREGRDASVRWADQLGRGRG